MLEVLDPFEGMHLRMLRARREGVGRKFDVCLLLRAGFVDEAIPLLLGMGVIVEVLANIQEGRHVARWRG